MTTWPVADSTFYLKRTSNVPKSSSTLTLDHDDKFSDDLVNWSADDEDNLHYESFGNVIFTAL